MKIDFLSLLPGTREKNALRFSEHLTSSPTLAHCKSTKRWPPSGTPATHAAHTFMTHPIFLIFWRLGARFLTYLMMSSDVGT